MKQILVALLLLVALLVAPTSTAHATEDVLVLAHTRAIHAAALEYLEAVAPAAGLRIVERILPAERDVIGALTRGDADVAIVSPVAAISARSQGEPVVLVAGFAPSPARILARKALGAGRIADLIHRRVAVQRGGNSELLLLSELRAASLGWSEGRDSDVQLVHLAAADLDAALRSGYVDAIVQQEPLASRAVQAGYASEIAHAGGRELDALLTSELAYGERGKIQRLVRCVVEAARLADEYGAADRRGGLALERVLWRDEVRDFLGHSPIVYGIDADDVVATGRRMLDVGMSRPTPGCTGCETQQLVKLDLLADAVRAGAGPGAGGAAR